MAVEERRIPLVRTGGNRRIFQRFVITSGTGFPVRLPIGYWQGYLPLDAVFMDGTHIKANAKRF